MRMSLNGIQSVQNVYLCGHGHTIDAFIKILDVVQHLIEKLHFKDRHVDLVSLTTWHELFRFLPILQKRQYSY